MLAHQIDNSVRTEDVAVVENVTFDSLLLSENILKGLKETGFKKPSPIQLKAIPVGRCGFDLIVKSKSGTGKTLVYAIIALESLKTKNTKCEVLILSPTREIAVQSHEVIKKLGCYFTGLQVESFIGGMSLTEDKEKCKRCHIAIGTPGRIKHLINDGDLKTDSIRLFVLDEADKLMEQSFRNDINEIYNQLPPKKQIITTSATYPNLLEDFLSKYMLSPTHITAELSSPLLLGIKQFVVVTKPTPTIVLMMKTKTEELINMLTNISFNQCLIFSNYQTRAESLKNILNQKGWPSTYISAAQSQTERLAAIHDLKDFKCRIMLTTDLTARGIDAANVDLVINYDLPIDAMTYLHRMGRAGRYGSTGICINLVSEGSELVSLQEILGYIGGSTLTIPKLNPFKYSIEELSKLEIPKEDHICSKINLDKNKKERDTNKIFEITKTKKQQNTEILNILNHCKDETEEVKKLVANMNTDDILDSIVNQKFPLQVNPTKTDFDSSVVLKMLSESSTKTVQQEENVKHKVTDAEYKEQEKEYLFTKNKTLLNVSTILNGGNSTESNTLLEKHLKNLKCEDKRSVDELAEKNVSDLLEMLKKGTEINENEYVECDTKVQNDKDMKQFENAKNIQPSTSAQIAGKLTIDTNYYIEKNDFQPSTSCQISETCDKDFNIEDIFTFGYKNIVKSDTDEWKDVLSKIERTKSKCTNEVHEIEYFDNEESMEEADNEESMEEAEYEEETTQTRWIPIKNTTKHSDFYVETEASANQVDVMKWIPVEKNINSNNQNSLIESNSNQALQEEDYQQFSNYYEECGNNLWQNGLSFSSVDEFDEWFYYEWEMQLYSIRNCVQQNIYVKEMSKYQNSRSGS